MIELKPDGKGGADIVWRWSFFDYLSHVTPPPSTLWNVETS